MELKWLEDMLILLEEGNFSRAAERRHVTQPAFSRRIRSLESWLGMDFIDRSRNPIEISQAARSCAPEVRALINRFHELKSRMRVEASARHRVSFAAQHTLAVSAFPPLIQLIQRSFEEVSYRLRSANKEDCQTLFLRGDTDFLLCYETDQTHGAISEDVASRLRLGKDRMVPVIGGSMMYRLDADGRPPDPVPFLAFPETSFLGHVVAQDCLPALIQHHTVDWVCESAFSSGIKELVLGGMGMAWLPSGLVRREVEGGRMTDLSHLYGSTDLDIMLYCRRHGGAFVAQLFEELLTGWTKACPPAFRA